MKKKKERRVYLPRVLGSGQVMMPADLKRLHKYMLDIEGIDAISDEMRAVVESEWPELAHKLPPKKDSSKREVNDETRSDRRKRGHFGFNCLGGGGECTSRYQPKHLPGHAGSPMASRGPDEARRHVSDRGRFQSRLRLHEAMPSPKGCCIRQSAGAVSSRIRPDAKAQEGIAVIQTWAV